MFTFYVGYLLFVTVSETNLWSSQGFKDVFLPSTDLSSDTDDAEPGGDKTLSPMVRLRELRTAHICKFWNNANFNMQARGNASS